MYETNLKFYLNHVKGPSNHGNIFVNSYGVEDVKLSEDGNTIEYTTVLNGVTLDGKMNKVTEKITECSISTQELMLSVVSHLITQLEPQGLI